MNLTASNRWRAFTLIERLMVITIIGVLMVFHASAKERLFLGPANPGAESGWDGWYNGVLGGGSVSIDTDDPAMGHGDFRIGITNADSYPTNHADIRSTPFSLEPTGRVRNKRGPFTFSFAYKLPGEVKPGDNIEVHFRFFGPGDKANFLGQKTFRVGSSTHDSEMTQYKTITVTNIFAPRATVQGDVWIVANIFVPWTSGYAQFDNFSITAAPVPPPWAKIFMGFGAFAALLVCALYAYRRRKRQADLVE